MAYMHTIEDLAKGECICQPPPTGPSAVLMRNQECMNSIGMQCRSPKDDQAQDDIPRHSRAEDDRERIKKREYALVSNPVYATIKRP